MKIVELKPSGEMQADPLSFIPKPVRKFAVGELKKQLRKINAKSLILTFSDDGETDGLKAFDTHLFPINIYDGIKEILKANAQNVETINALARRNNFLERFRAEALGLDTKKEALQIAAANNDGDSDAKTETETDITNP